MLWALADHQGSVKILLDNQGNVVNNITYDAFGNITVESNPDLNFRFSYTGRELDPETGLYNYRSRYYDLAIGQFISPDTIGFAGGDANLYRYVVNSPVNYIDPFGFRKNINGPQTLDGGFGGSPGAGGRSPFSRPAHQNGASGGGRLNTPAGGGYRGTDVPNSNPTIPQTPPSGIPNQLPPPTELPDDLDPLQINPDQRNNDFVNPGEPDSWFGQRVLDWFNRQWDRFTEQNQENQERQEQQNQDDGNGSERSCSPGDRDEYVPPEANSETASNSDGQPENNSESQNNQNDNTGDAWDEVPDDSMWDDLLESENRVEPSPTAQDIAEHGWNRPDRQLFSERGINSQEELAERVENTINTSEEVLRRDRDGAEGYYDEATGIAIIDHTRGNEKRSPEEQYPSSTFVTTDPNTNQPRNPRDYLIEKGFRPQ